MIENFAGKTSCISPGGFWLWLECAHWRPSGHEPGAGRCAAGRAGRRHRRDAGRRAQVLARKVDVSNAADGAACAGCAGTLRCAHLGSSTNGRGCGAAWGEPVKDWEWVLGVNLMGVVWRAPVHPHDASTPPKDPAWRGHYRQHGQHGWFAGAAQHGHPQREQARRSACPKRCTRTFAGHRPGQRQRCAPILRPRASTTAIATDRMPCSRASQPRARSLARR